MRILTVPHDIINHDILQSHPTVPLWQFITFQTLSLLFARSQLPRSIFQKYLAWVFGNVSTVLRMGAVPLRQTL